MAELAFRAVSAFASGTTSLVVAVPAGVVDGDLLVLTFTHKSGAYGTMPAGWTLAAQATEATSGLIAELHYRRASSEPANYTITGLADTACGCMAAYSGASTTTLLDAVTIRTNLAPGSVFPSFTDDFVSTASQTLVIGIIAGSGTTIGSQLLLRTGERPSATQLTSRRSGVTTNGTDCTIALADGFSPAPGNQGHLNDANSFFVPCIGILATFLPDLTISATRSASRLYATQRHAGTRLWGPPLGAWDAGESTRANRGLHFWRFLAHPDKSGGGTFQTDLFSDTPVTNGQILAYSWLTLPLASDQVMPATLTVTLRVRNRFTGPPNAVGQWHIHVWLTQGDTLTPRAILAADVIDPNLWTTTITFRSFTFPLAAIVGSAGDRIVIEVGGQCSPALASDNAFQLSFGTAEETGLPLADAIDGSSATAAGWFDLSSALSFAVNLTPPANDACADATVIAAAPYTSPLVDTTAAQNPDRAIYYRFTPTVSGRYFATAHGSNHSVDLAVYTGACGALSRVTAQLRAAWIATGQAVVHWEAVAGTPYLIQGLTENEPRAGNLTAPGSGGVVQILVYPYSAPIADDLFVSCQHIVSYRNGQAVDILPDFYGQTPTAEAIDYTLRPLDDLNGGIHTALRLYIGFFGFEPIIEILDLATLNVSTPEIDYILAAINLPSSLTHSRNLSSLVFDVAGRIIVGFYGSNYTVLGSLSSADAGAVRRIDATHADNQPGAPFAAPDRFDVQFERQASDFIDLAADQTTLFYTSAGWTIFRYDLATSTQLAAFATIDPSQVLAGPRPYLRGLRLLPPGDGSGGLLVTAGTQVLRLNAGGQIVQRYTPAATERAQDLDKVELTVDATAFWVSDQYSASVFKFNLATGAQLVDLQTNLPPGQLCGFTVLYGYRAGVTPVPPIPPPVIGGHGCPAPSFLLPGGGCVGEAPDFSGGT